MSDKNKTKTTPVNDNLDDSERIGKNIAVALKAYHMYIDRKLKAQDLDISRGPLFLLYLLYQEGPMTQHQLSELLYVDKAAVHRTTAKLIEKGFITREASQQDRRKILLHLTPKAYIYQHELSGILEEIDQEIKAQFPSQNMKVTLEMLKNVSCYLEKRSSHEF